MALLKKEKVVMIISLGDDGAIIGCYKNEMLIKRMFVTSPLSSDFIDLVKQYPDAVIYLLLDTIDQNYVFSNIPNVGKSSVKRIINRKMQTEFDPNDLNAYLFLGKDTVSAKKTLQYLFVSIRNGPPLKEWMDAINGFPNLFDGVYLVPVEAEDFIKKVRLAVHGDAKRPADDWEILVSYNRVGGFRQVVLKNEKLIFTRISQSISLQTPDAIGNSISQESANTLEYIRRIGFYDHTISIYIICAKEASNFIEIPGVKAKDVYHSSPFDLSQKMGLAQSAQENDKFGDVIFATSFAKNRKKMLRLQNADIAKAKRLAGLSKFISMASYMLIIFLALGSIYFFVSALRTSPDIGDAEKKIEQKTVELSKARNFEKEYGISIDRLTNVVKFEKDYSDKDGKFFDIIKKYKETDVYSNYIEKVTIADKEKDTAVAITVAFDFGSEKNYSDVLYKIEKYTVAIKSAFKDKSVVFQGLPNEKDIKVNLENSAAKAEKTEITVTITKGTPEGGAPVEN